MSRREELENRAQKAILQKALFRWENAIVISLATLLTTFDGLYNLIPIIPWWVWPLGGVAGVGALFYSSLTDPDVAGQAVAEMLSENYQPDQLKDKRLQQKVREALGHHARLLRAVQERGEDSLIGDELRQTADQMNEWIKEIYNLAQRLDRYRLESRIFGQNKQQALSRLNQMHQRLQMEDNKAVRKEIQANIESLEYQIETIEKLEDTMQRAELMLDNKLTAMGTIYLQSTLAGAKEIDSSRTRRLQQEIADEVQEMDDILLAMDEVYASGL